MGDPIISQAEIRALLQERTPQVPKGRFPDIISKTASDAGDYLRMLIPYAVEIEGPYIENVYETLDTAFQEDVYIVPVEMGSSELFVFVSSSDAAALGNTIGSNAVWALNTCLEGWMKHLASVLSDFSGLFVNYTLFPPRKLRPSQLKGLPTEEGTLLIRHGVNWDKEGMEVCFVVLGSKIQSLVEQRPTSNMQKRASHTVSIGGQSPSTELHKLPVAQVHFAELDKPESEDGVLPLELVRDITLDVTVELGHTSMTLEQLMELEPETVFALHQTAGDPVDVYVNNNYVAKAEVTILNSNFGVRIIEIVPQADRICLED